MKLSELVVTQKIKLLLVGDSGAGKTVFATSGPGKTYVFDFDTKISSAATYLKKHKPGQLDNIEFESYTLNKAIEKKEDHPYYKFKLKLKELETLAATGKFPFENVALDSLSLYSEALTSWILKTQKTQRAFEGMPSMVDYGLILAAFKEDINRVLSLPCNIICTAHSIVKEDPETGTSRTTISLTGQIGNHLPKIFTEVYYCFAKQGQAKTPGEEPKIEHVALTRSNGKFTCRTQIPEIPLWVKLDFPTIQHYLSKTTNEQEKKEAVK